MKKILIVTLVILSAICASAGDLKRAVRDLNRECPIELTYGMTMIKLTSGSSNVTCVCQLDEEEYNINYFKQRNDILREALDEVISWMGSDDDFSEMLEEMRSRKMELIFKITGLRSGKTLNETYTSKQYGKLI